MAEVHAHGYTDGLFVFSYMVHYVSTLRWISVHLLVLLDCHDFVC